MKQRFISVRSSEMSSSSSDTEYQSYQSDDLDWNYIPGPYNIEAEAPTESGENVNIACDSSHNDEDAGPYANEPVADKDWLASYRERRQTYEERLRELQLRLDGTEELAKW